MRKFTLTALLVGIIVAGLPATPSQAITTQPAGVRFVFPAAGTVPCAVGCSYWTPAASAGYRPCENPFPPTSIVDFLTASAPTPPAGKKMILELTTFPEVDWDTWICGFLSNGSPNGGELAQGANILGQLCDNALGADNPIPVGCIEQAQAPAEAGKRYVMRAYNWSDLRDAPAIYNWIMV